MVLFMVGVSGDLVELHDHAGGSSRPAAGHSGGKRETRTRGGEKPTDSSVGKQQTVTL